MEKGKIKYALVTGGSRGIGRAVSVRLAQMGFYVLVNCVSRMVEAEETLRLIREAGSDGEILPFDVSDRAQTAKVLEAWKDAHPDDYIQVLVNNAGIRRDNILALMPAEDWDKVLGIALDGFYNVTQLSQCERTEGNAGASQLFGGKGWTDSRYKSVGARGGTERHNRECGGAGLYPYRYDGRIG